VALCLRVVFWFNPLVYIAHYYYRLDQEASCDARVLKEKNNLQKKIYAETLLTAVTNTYNNVNSAHSIMSQLGKNNQLIERILMLEHHNRTAQGFKSGFALFILILISGLVSADIQKSIKTEFIFHKLMLDGKIFNDNEQIVVSDFGVFSSDDSGAYFVTHTDGEAPTSRTSLNVRTEKSESGELELVINFKSYLNYQEKINETYRFIDGQQNEVSLSFTDARGKGAIVMLSFSRME